MQNVLVSHNYLPSSACTRRALFGLERGAWGERWDGGAGDAGSAPVPGTALLSELHHPVGPHLLLHFTHCILPTMRPWCVVAFLPPPLQCCHPPAEPGTQKQGTVLLHATIHALNLLPQAPPNCFWLGANLPQM